MSSLTSGLSRYMRCVVVRYYTANMYYTATVVHSNLILSKFLKVSICACLIDIISGSVVYAADIFLLLVCFIGAAPVGVQAIRLAGSRPPQFGQCCHKIHITSFSDITPHMLLTKTTLNYH